MLRKRAKIWWPLAIFTHLEHSQGMAYLHKSRFGPHGHLQSSSCLVDSHWQVKVCHVGLDFMRDLDTGRKSLGEYRTYWKQLWTAPEILRMPEKDRPVRGTKKGDVYSFGIILQEVLYRAMPHFIEHLSPMGKCVHNVCVQHYHSVNGV